MFPTHKVTPILVQRIGQDKSPVQDKSEYHLIDRNGDYIIQNNLDESIYDEISRLIMSII